MDEPVVGADGREVGRQRELQRRLDELSTAKKAAAQAQHPVHVAAPRDVSEVLWAEAETICAGVDWTPRPRPGVEPPAAPPARRWWRF